MPPVIVPCDGASTATTTVATASTSVGLPEIQGWQDDLPSPPLILMDIIRGVAEFAAVPTSVSDCLLSPRLIMPIFP